MVRMLLIANIGVFFLQATLPGVTSAFRFVPALAIVRPWTLITYMFLHAGFMHLFFNMLGLFFFGSRVEDRLGSNRFLWLYFLSGISGAILSTIFSFYSPIIGASGGVFGVGLAFAYFWPHEPIYIWGVLPIPARVMVILQTAIALFSGTTGTGRGIAHFAHLGGYVGAYLYLKWIERGRQEFKRKAEGKIVGALPKLTKAPTIDMQRVHEVNRDEVNRILDKINRDGMGSLTTPERVFLSNFAVPEDRVPPTS
jgi:membrane associated rhomboid family serine protease